MTTLEAIVELQLRQLQPGPEPLTESAAEVAADVLEFLAHTGAEVRTLFDLALTAINANSFDQCGKLFAAASLAEREAVFEVLKKSESYALVSVPVHLVWLVVYSRPWARCHVGFEVMQGAAVELAEPARARLDEPWDVCVIGSGAGGAVAAFRLAEAGHRVLILEEGEWISPHELPTRDDAGLVRLFRNAGLNPALPDDFPSAAGLSVLNVLQARVAGGGPVVNNAIQLPMEEPTWKQWSSQHGFPVCWKTLCGAYKRVVDDLEINTRESAPARCERSERFAQGVVGLPDSAAPLDVSILDCIGCGGCNLGCRFGRKTAAPGNSRSYLQRALLAGAQLRTRFRASHFGFLPGSRTVQAIVGDDLKSGGEKTWVKARRFVLCAGPVASSSLLHTSGIRAGVGRGIAANVVTPVFAVWDKEFSRAPDPGLQMCVYVKRDGRLLETWFHFPGSLAAALPGWLEEHASVMKQYRRMAACGVVVPSANRGHVDYGILPGLRLSVSDEELERLKTGVVEIARTYFDAGAAEVFPATTRPMSFKRATFAQDEQHFRQAVLSPSDLGLATAHPQGGNAIGAASGHSVVDAEFRVRGFDNLHVADASLFPAGCDVNPQMTVMALAHLAADRILKGWGER